MALTCHEGYSSHCLLHSDLCDGREVEVCVVRHHYATEQHRHYTCSVCVGVWGGVRVGVNE